MWRWLAIAAVLYAGGHPALDAWRPAAFERSLTEFHHDVNGLRNDAVRTVTGLDQARAMQQFYSLGDQLQSIVISR